MLDVARGLRQARIAALADGAQVVVAGGCDYYPGSRTASPSFSFAVTRLRVAGEGDLLAQLDQLRKRLHAEGLFAPQKALPRPRLPKCIGVVTGESGKARDDVLAGLRRRGWAGRVVWGFAPVQDRHAAPAITRKLQDLAACAEVEVIVVARGGGSLADLFAFCDETLCRTVALLRVPVISSVGHHTDRTLLDDVAAVACSTPTHAAETAVPVDCTAARVALAQTTAACTGRAAARCSNAPARSHGCPVRPATTSPATARACTSSSVSCAPRPAAPSPPGSARAASAPRHSLARPRPRPGTGRAGEPPRTRPRWAAPPPRRWNARERDRHRGRHPTRAPRSTHAGATLALLASRLAAHDPQRTLERGYARSRTRQASRRRPRRRRASRRPTSTIRFRDGSVGAVTVSRTVGAVGVGDGDVSVRVRSHSWSRMGRGHADLRDRVHPPGSDHRSPGLRRGRAARDTGSVP